MEVGGFSSFRKQLALYFCVMLHLNGLRYAKTNVLALCEKTHPLILVIGHFTPTDPICLNPCNQCWWRKGFSIPELLPFFHWLLMFDNEEKQHLQFNRRICCFSSYTRRHGQSCPYQVFDICSSARCCCHLTVFLTAEGCCGKVITEMDDRLTMLNTQTMK